MKKFFEIWIVMFIISIALTLGIILLIVLLATAWTLELSVLTDSLSVIVEHKLHIIILILLSCTAATLIQSNTD